MTVASKRHEEAAEVVAVRFDVVKDAAEVVQGKRPGVGGLFQWAGADEDLEGGDGGEVFRGNELWEVVEERLAGEGDAVGGVEDVGAFLVGLFAGEEEACDADVVGGGLPLGTVGVEQTCVALGSETGIWLGGQIGWLPGAEGASPLPFGVRLLTHEVHVEGAATECH